MLYDKVFDVFVVDIVAVQAIAAVELRLQPQGVDHSGNAVEVGQGSVEVGSGHGRDSAYGLSYRSRFADAAGFDNNVVESASVGDVGNLLYEVHFQSAADAAVLQGYKVVGAVLAYDAAFLNQFGIDIYFADVVDYYSKAYAASVVEYAVEQSGLATAEIAGQQ